MQPDTLKITPRDLKKTPTGIQGFDEITLGGLPDGRPTLVCGQAGSGKTLFAMEFLVRGATQFDEPGVCMAFEETAGELAQNVASLGFDLDDLIKHRRLVVDYVYIERSEIEATGEYDLEGLFIRLEHAIQTVGAKRVVLDTIEALFAGLPNPMILRAELRRLFRWLKTRGVTAVITGERGEKTLTRQGLEEYVSDCVILLDHRVTEQISTRRLRVVKYRGSAHGTNEYPFLIDKDGFSVLPVTSLGLNHSVSRERISSGVRELDHMLAGKGYFKGSTILVSGTAGTGKTSLAAHFIDAACRRGERVLYFIFEESPSQVRRNMRSIGINLQQWESKGLLRFQATRPMLFGLEMHLATTLKAITEFEPQAVVMDPINTYHAAGNQVDVKTMLIRITDFLKTLKITSFFTHLTSGNSALEHTDVNISSLIDTWLLLRDIETGGERNRGLYILKSRGMSHSNQIREFILTGRGIVLQQVYVGAAGVLTGSARLAQETAETAAQLLRTREIEKKQQALEHRRKLLKARIETLQAEFEADELEVLQEVHFDLDRIKRLEQDRLEMAASRKVVAVKPARQSNPKETRGKS